MILYETEHLWVDFLCFLFVRGNNGKRVVRDTLKSVPRKWKFEIVSRRYTSCNNPFTYCLIYINGLSNNKYLFWIFFLSLECFFFPFSSLRFFFLFGFKIKMGISTLSFSLEKENFVSKRRRGRKRERKEEEKREEKRRERRRRRREATWTATTSK